MMHCPDILALVGDDSVGNLSVGNDSVGLEQLATRLLDREFLGEASAFSGPPPRSGAPDPRSDARLVARSNVRWHLTHCDACRGVVELAGLRRSARSLDCVDAELEIAALADDLLSDDRRRQLARHLSACDPCRRVAGRVLLEEQIAAAPAATPGGIRRMVRALSDGVAAARDRLVPGIAARGAGSRSPSGDTRSGDSQSAAAPAAPPRAARRGRLPPSLRRGLWSHFDAAFATAFALVLMFELPALLYLHTIDRPEPITFDQVDERWAHLITPEQSPPPPVRMELEGRRPLTPAPAQPAEAPRERRERARVVARQLAGDLGIAGGAMSGAVAEVFGADDLGIDLDVAFEGIGESKLDVAGASGRRQHDAVNQGIALMGSQRPMLPPEVRVARRERESPVEVTMQTPAVDGRLDVQVVFNLMQRRMGLFRACYESALRRNSQLAGKISLEIHIARTGVVTDVEIDDDTIGSGAVASCLASRMRRLRFPKSPGGVTVTVPLVFMPSH